MFKRNLLSILIIISLAIAIFTSVAILFTFLLKHFSTKSEIAFKCELINKLTEKGDMPLTKESLIFVTDEENKLKNIYSRFKLALESPMNEEIAEEELDPLQFKERLIQIQKKLREDAAMYNLTLPESLGLAEYETELSKPSEIPDLIMRLRVLEEVIYTITLSGIDSLHEIHFVVEEDAKEEEAIYFDLPVSFEVGCTSSKLINLLYKLRLSAFNLIIDDLDIKSAQAPSSKGDDKKTATDGEIVASLSIRATAFY